MANDGRKHHEEHGTPFSLDRNLPPDFEKILDGLGKASRRYGYLATPNEVRGAIAAAVSGECSRGMADNISRFLENQGILLSDGESGRFYVDTTRAIHVRSALREGTLVLPAEDKEARLHKVRKSVMAKRRKKLRGKQAVILLPGDRRREELEETASQEGSAAMTPEAVSPEIAPPEPEPVEETTEEAPGEAAEKNDASTTAAEVTLHEVLRQLKINYGWPDADLLPTAVMRAVSMALHPHYKNTSQAPSHWRRQGLLIARGRVRSDCMIWEVRPNHYTCPWLESCTVKPLNTEEVTALLDMLFKEHSLKQAIEDARAGMALPPVAPNGDEEKEEVQQPPAATRRAEEVPKGTAPAKEGQPGGKKNLDEVEVEIRRLLQERKELRKAAKEERQREERRADLRRQIAEIEAAAERLRAAESEENRQAEEARQLFRHHKAIAEQQAKEAEGREQEAEALRQRLRELTPA